MIQAEDGMGLRAEVLETRVELGSGWKGCEEWECSAWKRDMG